MAMTSRGKYPGENIIFVTLPSEVRSMDTLDISFIHSHFVCHLPLSAYYLLQLFLYLWFNFLFKRTVVTEYRWSTLLHTIINPVKG